MAQKQVENPRTLSPARKKSSPKTRTSIIIEACSTRSGKTMRRQPGIWIRPSNSVPNGPSPITMRDCVQPDQEAGQNGGEIPGVSEAGARRARGGQSQDAIAVHPLAGCGPARLDGRRQNLIRNSRFRFEIDSNLKVRVRDEIRIQKAARGFCRRLCAPGCDCCRGYPALAARAKAGWRHGRGLPPDPRRDHLSGGSAPFTICSPCDVELDQSTFRSAADLKAPPFLTVRNAFLPPQPARSAARPPCRFAMCACQASPCTSL